MTETLTILIPMAGRGSRFAAVGYREPKPLIDVAGRPMIAWVVENVRPARPHRFVFVCQEAHRQEFGLDALLAGIAPGCAVVGIDGITEGAACTVLAAAGAIDVAQPLMIANSDQWVEADIDAHLRCLDDAPRAAGLIMTMGADDPKWSFVARDAGGRVTRVVEKEVVSNEATVGIYTFRTAGLFIDGAERMIRHERRVNGEFYVAPVYNELIEDGREIVTDCIGTVTDRMHGLGTPADLDAFLAWLDRPAVA